MKLKKGDNVIVLTGKDKGKKGKITKVVREEDLVVIDGLNMWKRHQRPRQRGQKGSITEVIKPIHASNVALLDPKNNKPTRVGHKMVSDKKIRVAKKSGMEI
jgi:large subunit ribosomal protein L24